MFAFSVRLAGFRLVSRGGAVGVGSAHGEGGQSSDSGKLSEQLTDLHRDYSK